jgi:purine-binding chemotaxis protein CheW
MSGIPELPQPPAAPAPAVPPTPPPSPASPVSPGAARPPAAPRLALFRLGSRLCGVAAAFCKQFVELDAVTPVPLAPAYLLGVTQLRGHILPVLDASRLPGLSAWAPPESPEAPAAPSTAGAQPATAGGRQALVVTATGLDSALAALAVTEIVGFERPSFAAAAPAAPAAGDVTAGARARPLWRGEEVAVLDVAALLAGLRPGVPPRHAARARTFASREAEP